MLKIQLCHNRNKLCLTYTEIESSCVVLFHSITFTVFLLIEFHTE